MKPLHKILYALAIVCLLLLITLYQEGALANERYCYARLGLGKNAMLFSNNEWNDQNSIGGAIGAGCRHHLTGNLYGEASYTHYSQPFVGAPFTDETETATDHLYYFVEFRF